MLVTTCLSSQLLGSLLLCFDFVVVLYYVLDAGSYNPLAMQFVQSVLDFNSS